MSWRVFTTDDNEESSDGGSNKIYCMKRFWRFIKFNKTDNTGIAALKTEGSTVSDPVEKAEALNKQFQGAFTRETNIPPNILPDTSPYVDMLVPFQVSGYGYPKILG